MPSLRFENFCAMIIQQWWRNKHRLDKDGRPSQDDDNSSVSGSSYSYSYSTSIYSQTASQSHHSAATRRSSHHSTATRRSSHHRSKSPSSATKESMTVPSKSQSRRSSTKSSPATTGFDKYASFSTATSPDASTSPDRRSSSYQQFGGVVVHTKSAQPVPTMLVEDACEIIQRAWRSYLVRNMTY